MERLTSRANPLLVHLRKLGASRAYRRDRGEYLCDGVKLLEEALRWEAPVVALAVESGTVLPALPAAVRAVEVSADLLKSISPLDTPQKVLFSVKIPESAPPEDLEGRTYLVLDGLQDPGNLGTILRTADAFEADGVFLLPGCADLWSPKTVRGAMGALFRRPVWRTEREELRTVLSRAGIPLIGAALGEHTADVRKLPVPAALAVGSEGRGLSPETLALCQGTVRIPMSPRCESLNAAVAAAVLLWERYRGEPAE